VDHGGKLFERLEVNTPAAGINHIETTHPGEPLHPASFCPRHGNWKGREFSASLGWVLLLLFLSIKKSKIEKSSNEVRCFRDFSETFF
jgi:hypothetical protein